MAEAAMAAALGASEGRSACASSMGSRRGWASRCVLDSLQKHRLRSSSRPAHTSACRQAGSQAKDQAGMCRMRGAANT